METATNIKTITDLIKDLSLAYGLLRDRKLELPEAKEIANLGGKLIKAASIQLKYNQYMKSNDVIPFLEKSAT